MCSGRAQGSAILLRPPESATALPPLIVTRQLHGEHRRLEQTLTLLLNDSDAARETLRRCVDDLSAHLLADASLLYPILEEAWHRPVVELRDPQHRMRQLLPKLKAPGVNAHRRRALLQELLGAFREHARVEEASALPWLEGSTSSPVLAELGRNMRAMRAKLMASSRSPRSRSSD